MAQVTAFTAEKTLSLIGESIVEAHIDGYDLVVTNRNGEEFNLGNVRGPSGTTGGVSLADMNAAILVAKNSAISTAQSANNALESTTGKGLVAFDEDTVHRSFIGQAGVWVDVPGVSVSYPFVSGRAYEFKLAGALRSEQANQNLVMGIRDSSNVVVARGGGGNVVNSWVTPISGSRILIAPGGWGTRTYKLSCYATTDFEVHIESAIYPAQLSIIDHGILD